MTVSALALSVLPKLFNRSFAVPMGVALIGLGLSLRRGVPHPAATPVAALEPAAVS